MWSIHGQELGEVKDRPLEICGPHPFKNRSK